MKRATPVILLCSLLLLPFVYACFFALPFADDFCFGWTASAPIPFIQKFLNQYLYWNGRYTSDILVNLHPMLTGRLWVNSALMLVALAGTVAALYFLIRYFALSKNTSLAAALFLSLLWLNYLPIPAESFYWYIGQANYYLPNLLFILQIALLLRIIKKGGHGFFAPLLSCLLLIAAIGCNENAALLAPAFYATACYYNHKHDTPGKRAIQKLLLLHLAIAMAAAAFVFFSPGNLVRGAQFTGNHRFLHSLLYSAAQTLRFTGKWVVSYAWLVYTLIIMAAACRWKQLTRWRLPLAFAFFAAFAAFFLPYFATGTLGQHRTAGFAYPWFIAGWSLFAIAISNKYGLYKYFANIYKPGYFTALLITTVLYMLFTGNLYNLNADIVRGNFIAYKREFMQRQQLIVQGAPIAPLLHVPGSFQITDAKTDTAWWANKCMHNFYKEGNVILK